MKRKPREQRALSKIYTDTVIPPPPPVFDGSIDGLARMVKGDLESVADARRRLVELLRGETDMAKFVKAADKLFKGKVHVKGKGDTPDLDFICERAGVNRSDVFGACARVLHRYHFDVAQIQIGAVIANRAHDVAQAMAESAMVPSVNGGDRKLFMEVAGGTKRGGGVNVNVHASANAAAKAEAVAETTGREMPQFEAGIKDMAAKLRAIPARFEETR
jgi:hypothetical protein